MSKPSLVIDCFQQTSSGSHRCTLALLDCIDPDVNIRYGWSP